MLWRGQNDFHLCNATIKLWLLDEYRPAEPKVYCSVSNLNKQIKKVYNTKYELYSLVMAINTSLMIICVQTEKEISRITTFLLPSLYKLYLPNAPLLLWVSVCLTKKEVTKKNEGVVEGSDAMETSYHKKWS